jgi:NADH dehydrogenase FAD-containing subunit
MESPNKNIVVVGAGYGGITATLRVARLFRDCLWLNNLYRR